MYSRNYAIALVGVCGTLLLACSPKHADSVDSLLANPAQLDEVRERCRTYRVEVGEAICQAAARAVGKRMGSTDIPYTPHRVDFDAPAHPADSKDR